MVRGRNPGERAGRAVYNLAVAGGFVFMVMPILLVLWLSFFSNEILTFPPDGYSLRWYKGLVDQQQFISGFMTSLQVAVLATALGLVVSIPASLALTRLEFRGRQTILQLLLAPLVVPAIVIGTSLYVLFVEIEIATEIPAVGSVVGLSLAHVLITIPWCVRLITANLVGVNPAIEEAAASLGARPATVVFKVTLPLIWPGIVAAALFGFVTSFGNLEISLFLIAPGQTTLRIAILQYLAWKIDPTIAAVSAMQILVIAAALLITDRFVSLSRVV